MIKVTMALFILLIASAHSSAGNQSDAKELERCLRSMASGQLGTGYSMNPLRRRLASVRRRLTRRGKSGFKTGKTQGSIVVKGRDKFRSVVPDSKMVQALRDRLQKSDWKITAKCFLDNQSKKKRADRKNDELWKKLDKGVELKVEQENFCTSFQTAVMSAWRNGTEQFDKQKNDEDFVTTGEENLKKQIQNLKDTKDPKLPSLNDLCEPWHYEILLGKPLDEIVSKKHESDLQKAWSCGWATSRNGGKRKAIRKAKRIIKQFYVRLYQDPKLAGKYLNLKTSYKTLSEKETGKFNKFIKPVLTAEIKDW